MSELSRRPGSALAWKLSRLSAMGLPEILYRARQAVHSRLEQRGYRRARPMAPKGAIGRPWCEAMAIGVDLEPYRAAADAVLAGNFDVFAAKGATLGFPPDWNRDPKTGTLVPLDFGKTLNYRDEAIVGDIKYLWEPNRHTELVTLAQAWYLTRDIRYAEGCRVLLDSWFEQCPYPLGVHWVSSLEHGIRLVNWSFAWYLLGGEASPLFSGETGKAFCRRWQDGVYRHLHFIAGRFSRHSSANNHLLGELMGLFIGATTWPLWPESKTWQQQAGMEFEQEALKQTAQDGVNREQAIWYHHEVADMMLLCGLVGRANGIEFSGGYWRRLEAMLEFIASVMDVGGNVPMIGDADDAVMVRLSREADFDAYRSLLTTGAVLFKRRDFKTKAGRFDDKSRWLLGDAAEGEFDALSLQKGQLPIRRAFPDGGYCILGSEFDAPNEVRIVADVGPLGYLSIAAHGHADALSFTLSAGGRELLIDSGTYAYHTQKQWRDYFRGTSAHNTLRVDGEDQSVAGGNFLWVRHAIAACENFESEDGHAVLSGSHDGYLRLRRPVRHRRRWEYIGEARRLLVTDELAGSGRHRVELFWHFAEGCEVLLDGEMIRAHDEGVSLNLAWPPGLQARLARGEENPPLGWVSRSFDSKMPCTTVVIHGDVECGWQGTTTIEISFSGQEGES